MRRNLSYYCLLARHINGVILHAHPVRGESHNQRNATGEVSTTSPPFYNEPHRSHVLCVKAELETTSTSGHSIILLQSDIQSGMCAKLRTVAASNNRDHESQFLLPLLARATYIMVLLFTHIPLVVNHTINATPPERLQQYRKNFRPFKFYFYSIKMHFQL